MKVLVFSFLLIAAIPSAQATNRPKFLRSCEPYLVNLLNIDLSVGLQPIDFSKRLLETMQDTMWALYGNYMGWGPPARRKTPVIPPLEMTAELTRQLWRVQNDYVHPSRNRRSERAGLLAFLPSVHTKLYYDAPNGVEYYREFYSPLQKYFSTVLTAYSILQGYVDPQKVRNVVDLGAGTGDTTNSLVKFFPKAKIVALDRSTRMLDRLQGSYPGVETVVHDFEQLPLPFASNSQDYVVSICAAGQYLDAEQFRELISEIRRILRPGGYFLMEFGEGGHTVAAITPHQGLQSFMTMFRARGFDIVIPKPLEISITDMESYYPLLVRKNREYYQP